ncbi:MAG: pilus assembly FimT family protein [Terriglobia bacterium]
MAKREQTRITAGHGEAGFTLIELMMVTLVLAVLMGMSIPLVQSASRSYGLSTAVLGVTGAIQSTRYQAIMHGYPYALVLDPASQTFQIQSEPPGSSSFSNVGGAVPWSSGGGIVLAPATTFQFNPGGIVTVNSGSMVLTLSNTAATETVTVSEVGNVTVNP